MVCNTSNDGWNGTHIIMEQGSILTQGYQNELRNALVLDSVSSVDLICNPDMVTNIKITERKLHLGTNRDEATATKKAELKGYGQVWFNEKSITNIISLAGMAKKY